MRVRRLQHLRSAVLLTALFCPALLHTVTAQTLRYVTVNEETLRKYAAQVVMPSYPERARKNNVQGVVVAQLDVNDQGNVTGVEVLEAPDPLINEAVRTALKQWKFNSPTIHGKPVPIRGKLTFYYLTKNGKSWVENPKQFK